MEQLVSVVIPAFNAEKYIAGTLSSVCMQTYHNLEILVVNDVSTDQTEDIVREFMTMDKRIHLVNLERNGGVANARNIGVRVARGRYIAFLDSDDLWTPDKIQSQMDVVLEKQAKLVFTGSVFIDEEGNKLSSTLHVPETIQYKELLNQNLISCSSVLIDKKEYVRYPMPAGDLHEDFATWLRILRDGVTAYGIDRPMLLYRMTQKSRSGNKWHSAMMNYRVYRYIGLNRMDALYHELIYMYRGIRKYGKIHKVEKPVRNHTKERFHLEVLISCMHQKDFTLAVQTGIQSDTLIINQCPESNYKDVLSEGYYRNHKIRMLTTNERGLSRSRNLAIEHAHGNVVLICDDDETLKEKYDKIIENAYRQIPDADIIAFRMENQECRLKPKAQRLNAWTCMRISSWQITFKPEAVKARNIRFDEYMGAGTGNGAGEEVKFLRDCIHAGLKAYYVPEAIGTVRQTDSTWFQGFTREFFYQRGIVSRYMLGLPLAILYAFYYTIVKKEKYQQTVSPKEALFCTLKGIYANEISREKQADEDEKE